MTKTTQADAVERAFERHQMAMGLSYQEIPRYLVEHAPEFREYYEAGWHDSIAHRASTPPSAPADTGSLISHAFREGFDYGVLTELPLSAAWNESASKKLASDQADAHGQVNAELVLQIVAEYLGVSPFSLNAEKIEAIASARQPVGVRDKRLSPEEREQVVAIAFRAIELSTYEMAFPPALNVALQAIEDRYEITKRQPGGEG